MCSNTAFRNLLIIRNVDISMIFVIAVLIAIIGYFFLSLNFLPNLNFISSPLSFSLILVPAGGFIFGIGMVLAGGCAGGTCYRIGEGNSGSILAFVGYIFGIHLLLAFSSSNNLVSRFEILIDGKNPSLEMILPRWFWTIFIGGISLIVLIYYLKKKRIILPHLRKKWTPIRVGIILGVIMIIARISSSYSGRQFGLSTIDGIIEIFSPITSRLGLVEESNIGWAGLFILGLVAGSFFSSINIKEFAFCMPTWKVGFRYLSGGFLLGTGAMLAGGCNIGHILGGIPELGFASFVALLFMILGNLFASYIYYQKLSNPLPNSTPIFMK